MRIIEAALLGPGMGLIHSTLAARKASWARELENIAAQVLVLGDFGKLFGHVGSVDLHVFLL